MSAEQRAEMSREARPVLFLDVVMVCGGREGVRKLAALEYSVHLCSVFRTDHPFVRSVGVAILI